MHEMLAGSNLSGQNRQMEIESLSIDELSEDPANVRDHGSRNIAAIKASLKRFGQQKPIVIDENNVVRAGNGTLAAAHDLGWSNIDCVRSDLQSIELAAFAIADNRTAELASWSDELGFALEQLIDDGVNLKDVGFSEDEMKKLMTSEDIDTEPQLEGLEFRVLVACKDEGEQAALLERFEKEGLKCSALIS
jgi:ParB-like chromosome segregation protein Spo0J